MDRNASLASFGISLSALITGKIHNHTHNNFIERLKNKFRNKILQHSADCEIIGSNLIS